MARGRFVAPAVVGIILEELLARDLACAPHVLAGLAVDLDAHAPTVREVVESLTPEQRHGHRPLPSPLPLVPSIARRFDTVELESRDRQLLLALSVSLEDDLEPLLAFDGRSASEVAAAPVGDRLRVHAGRVRFVDARLSIWIRATSSAATTAVVHERLSTVFRARGDQVRANWHHARASLEGDPAAAPELIDIAGQLSDAGHPERALLLAREASDHATASDRDDARLVAGTSALAAGFVSEASAWLNALYSETSDPRRSRGFGALLVAQTLAQGAVPEIDPSSLRPESDDPEDWRHWTRASALVAVMCAERGDRRGMRVWLDALREGAARTGAERELRDPAIALSWLIAGERDVDEVAGSGPVSGGMLSALRAALHGDIDRARRLLAKDDSAIGSAPDPLVPGYEHSPIIQAYRRIVDVLLLAWRGDIGLARERLIQAALVLPVALPFAGLGVVLARRLDLAVLGELGPFSLSLTAALPNGARIDVLVDRGIQSLLAGAFHDAAATVRLWAELGSPRTAMSVPALDELALTVEARPMTVGSIEPPEIALAQRLRVRIATAGDARWRSERDAVTEAARTLASPFTRARVETMLGTQHAIHDDHAAARVHLHRAERLFEVSGATAWARSIRDRIDRLDAREGSIVPAADPLSACRAAWSLALTARELEVAMLAVGGSPNRDIAEMLNVSVRTVEVHLGRIFTKFDVRSRVELTVLAHRTDHHL
ncbi:response regulator transcription factor [Microbacterium aurugineum]|uniref:response regulator transcription factor n=1 Tax=Microbacterium aurugineum TaxID=2851642 RepID=UPI0020BEA8DD|nr:helix-turn-helix transcriptional regulator [Microbacterium aurugineum]MCK8477309.1 helix-turn-helix transcriptional regulator [Microbacterium aurugineum]